MGSFAAGKGTALVIDIGQNVASVTPVVDGFVLRKGNASLAPTHSSQLTEATSVQGRAHASLPQYVRKRAKHILTNPSQNRQAIDLYPHQLIAEKKVTTYIMSTVLHLTQSPACRRLRAADLYSTSGSDTKCDIILERMVRGS